MYKSLFIDLDDTLWAFSWNAEDTFREVYQLFDFNRYFDSFEHYYSLYKKRNAELWVEYGNGSITKDELNEMRFSHPFRAVGVEDEELFRVYPEAFFARIPLKSKLMPHAREALEYLAGRYRLYILSNGFRNLQEQKMRSAGISDYFEKVILSEDLGVHKPYPELFHFALSVAHVQQNEALMIGDSWEADIEGARAAGIHQLFYNYANRTDLNFKPTFEIRDWSEIDTVL